MFDTPTQSVKSSPLPSIDALERIYAVGDIHGRHDLLCSVISQISEDVGRYSDARKSRVVFLGDYIDRGDQSREVIETLSHLYSKRDQISDEAQVQLNFLAGNHEKAMLRFLSDPVSGKDWLQWGGIQTLASFGIGAGGSRPSTEDLYRMRDELSQKIAPHLGFLENLETLIVSGDVVFVHAGLDPDAPLDRQPEEATLWGRAPSGKPLGLAGYRMVHGHFDATEPVSLPERICVDTGAYYSGRLSVVRLDDNETFLQADP